MSNKDRERHWAALSNVGCKQSADLGLAAPDTQWTLLMSDKDKWQTISQHLFLALYHLALYIYILWNSYSDIAGIQINSFPFYACRT